MHLQTILLAICHSALQLTFVSTNMWKCSTAKYYRCLMLLIISVTNLNWSFSQKFTLEPCHYARCTDAADQPVSLSSKLDCAVRLCAHSWIPPCEIQQYRAKIQCKTNVQCHTCLHKVKYLQCSPLTAQCIRISQNDASFISSNPIKTTIYLYRFNTSVNWVYYSPSFLHHVLRFAEQYLFLTVTPVKWGLTATHY